MMTTATTDKKECEVSAALNDANDDELGDLATKINGYHRQCEGAARSAVEHARAAGDALLAAKGKVQHGDWLDWLADHCTCNERTSQRYMTISRDWEKLIGKTTRVSFLSLRKALKLLSEKSVHHTSESDQWNTPLKIIAAARAVLGTIDLDPCSDSKTTPNVPAERHYTVEDDGLIRPWTGRVFLNPPYGKTIGKWVERLIEQYRVGNVTEGIVLLPSRTDTEWFSTLRQFPRCFLRGRLRFGDAENSAPFPSVVVFLGQQPERFIDTFELLGDVYELISKQKRKKPQPQIAAEASVRWQANRTNMERPNVTTRPDLSQPEFAACG